MWMDLEMVIQREVSQKEENILYNIAYMWSVGKCDMDELIWKAEVNHRYGEQIYGYQGGERGRDELGNWD